MRICLERKQKGVALLIVLFMVSFLFVFVTANSNALFGLKREIKLIDQKQKARWSDISTNRVAARGKELSK